MRLNRTINGESMSVYISRGLLPNAWDEACDLTLTRYNRASGLYCGVSLDPGVNFFTLHMERMGCETVASCQGHPRGFYISFVSSEDIARRLVGAGFFTVELGKEPGRYILTMRGAESIIETDRDRIKTMRQAASVWDQVFGPLDLGLAARTAIDNPFRVA